MTQQESGLPTDRLVGLSEEPSASRITAMDEPVSELEHDLRTYLATRGDLNGRIGPFTPVELIQFMQFSRKCGLLRLFSTATRQAQCMVTNAGISSVVSDHLRDTEAALSFLGWKTGWFVFEQRSHLTSVEMCLNVNSVLMEAARLEDELHKRREWLPGREEHLFVAGAAGGPQEDPLDCGLLAVFDRIADRPGTTCGELERSIESAPIKVRLAVSCLVGHGFVKVAVEEERARPSAESDPQGWWQGALQRFPDGFRVLVGLPPAECPEQVMSAIEHLAQDLETSAPPTRYSARGPTFVRLRDPRGGLLSLTLLPIEKRQRFLFESLSRSMHFTIVCGGDEEEVAVWKELVPKTVALRCMAGTCCEGQCDMYTHIRRFASGDGCPRES